MKTKLFVIISVLALIGCLIFIAWRIRIDQKSIKEIGEQGQKLKELNGYINDSIKNETELNVEQQKKLNEIGEYINQKKTEDESFSESNINFEKKFNEFNETK